MSKLFYRELLHMLNCRCVIDLTCNDFILPFAALEQKVPYFGFTFSDVHTETGMDHFQHRVLQAFTEEGNALYQAGYAELIGRIEREENSARRRPRRQRGTAAASGRRGPKSATQPDAEDPAQGEGQG